MTNFDKTEGQTLIGSLEFSYNDLNDQSELNRSQNLMMNKRGRIIISVQMGNTGSVKIPDNLVEVMRDEQGLLSLEYFLDLVQFIQHTASEEAKTMRTQQRINRRKYFKT